MTSAPLVGYAAPPDGDQIVPRPVLHPVRTPGGAPVTGAEPGDHPWHRGMGLGLPDVDGTNLWGGPTYVAGRGYDPAATVHGAVHAARGPAAPLEQAIEDTLSWCAASGERLLLEERRVEVALHADRLVLDWHSVLSADRPVRVGSPASNGRPGAAYGGFFWRLPPLDPSLVQVRTPDATGEQATNGVRADWLEIEVADPARPWRGRITPLDERTAADPWFVRVEEYVGLGSSLAAERPLVIGPGRPVTIALRVELVDLAGATA